jgi:photosystem II stability/assembly factor-like uncharacterized protein
MKRLGLVLLFLLISSPFGCSDRPPSVSWEPVETHLRASLRGLSAVDAQTAWISGTGGGFAFTRDGGESWVVGTVAGADSLDFRDVEAFPDGTAYLMSAGSGTLSRIYKTTDWGGTWSLQHTNPLESGFFNGMAFWDGESGMVVGDPIDGTLFLLATMDGGKSWERVTGAQLPEVLEGEYGFAASGTNITTFGDGGLAAVSGGPVARVFRTPDRGGSWDVLPTPVAAGNASSGIFSIAFRDINSAVVVGGDYQNPEETAGTVALSTDGGMTWMSTQEPHGVGFRSGVAWREDPLQPMWVAVGTSGSSYSLDEGQSWVTFDGEPYNAVAFAGSVGWAAGADGRVARLLVQ